MRDQEDMFTIEIDLDAQKQPSESNPVNENPNPIKKIELSVSEILQKLSDLAAKKSSNTGQQLSDELRKIIFNKNCGAVKSTQAKFYEQAQKFTKLVAQPCVFVSFNGYWPTYEMLTQSQLKWYLFWRSQIREGIYPETSLSYIFLYLYEVINQVGIEDECDGFIKICNVCGYYRKSFEELDRYFVTWIADYIEIHFKRKLPEYILNSVSDTEIINLLPFDVLFDYIITTEQKAICGLSTAKYIAKLSSYTFENSTFISNLTIKEAEDELTDIFKFVENLYRKEKGNGLLLSLIPERYFNTTRMAYSNAVYCIEPKKVRAVGFDLRTSKELKIFFTGMFKLVENLFRIRAGKKKLLKTNLPEDLERLLIGFANQRYKEKLYEQRTNITINADEIKKLIKSSNEVRDKLLEGTINEVHFEENIEEVVENEISASVKETSNNFCDYLSPLQSEIFELIIQMGGKVTEAELNEKYKGSFIQMEIDAINEAAIDFFGDMLFILDDGCYIIQEF